MKPSVGEHVRYDVNRGLPTLYFLLAWMFLNLLINLNYPARDPNLVTPLMPSLEVWSLLLALCAAVWLGMPFHPAIYLPLTMFFIFFRLFRIGDVLMPIYFDRSFNLYMDIQYVPDLIHLLHNTVSRWTLIGYVLLSIGLFVGAAWGIWKALKTIHAYFAIRRQRYIFLGITTVLVGFRLFSYTGPVTNFSAIFPKPFFPRVVEEVEFILRIRDYNTQSLSILQEGANNAKRFPVPLDKLAGASVYLFFVESYGHTVFADSRHFSLIAPVFEEFEQTLAIHGFDMYSHFMTAATYGGASWLSHATVVSGVRTYDQTQYNLLLNSNIKPLARYFNDAGYRTISAMPGTTSPWPEGDFFGYQKTYFAWHFKYNGPQYSWAPMPDQFVLDYIFRREIQPKTRPLFIEYILVSSHAPFNNQPPYLENWSQIGDGAIFHEKEHVTFPTSWADMSNATEAYMTAIIYDMRVLMSYLAQYIEDDALIIILGDHQPNVQITGENSLWSVPIHVISRNPALLEPFAKRGYMPGMIPQQSLPHPGMETFLFNFLEDFSPTVEYTVSVSGNTQWITLENLMIVPQMRYYISDVSCRYYL